MQEVVKEYGKFIITGLVTLAALTLIFSPGVYEKAAVANNVDIAKEREGPELEAVGVSHVNISCLGIPELGQRTKLTDLFEAEGYPVALVDVIDEQGRCLKDMKQEMVLEHGELTIHKAGVYQFYVRVIPCRKTEIFTIRVTDKGEL